MNLAKIRDNLLLWPLFIPLIFTSFSFQPWHFGKTILLVILIDILLILTIFDCFREKQIEIKFNNLDKLLAVFFALCIGLSFFAFDVTRAFFGTITRANGILIIFHFYLYYLLLRNLFQSSDWLKVFRITALVGFLSILIAWLGSSLAIFSSIVPKSYTRLSGLMGNPIVLASYFCVVLIILSLAIFEDKNKKWKIFYYVTFILSIVTIFGSGTRGAILAFFIGLFFFLGGFIFFLQQNKKVKLFSSLILVLALSFILYLYLPIGSQIRSSLPANVAQVFNLSKTSLGVETRLMAWEIAWNGFVDRPIIGWGASNFQFAFDKFYNPNFLSYGLGETVWDIPHNEFLEILVSFGGLIFLFFIAIIYLVIKKSFWLFKANKLQLILFFSALITYLVQSMFAAESTNTLIYLFVILTFLQAKSLDTKKIVLIKNYYNVFLVLILFFSIVSIICSTRILVMSKYLVDARDARMENNLVLWQSKAQKSLAYKDVYAWEQAIELSSDLINFGDTLKQGDNLENIYQNLSDILSKKDENLEDNYLLNFWLAQLYGNRAEYVDGKYYESALAYLEQAELVNRDRQYIGFLRARYLLASGNLPEAEKTLRVLTEKNAKLVEPHWFLGVVLSASGNLNGAAMEFEEAIKLGFKLDKVNNILYLIDIYASLENYEKIVPLYELLIATDPNNANWYARLATTYVMLQDNDKVIEYMSKAIEIDPSMIPEAKEFLKKYNISL